MPASSSTSYGQVSSQKQYPSPLRQQQQQTHHNMFFATQELTSLRAQVIEYIQDRLYLASYTNPPDAHTPFPYPRQHRSPSKRSAKAQSGPVSSGPKVHPPVYFSVDKQLLYNAFHADFGPLHIGHLYRFAVQLHEVLGDPKNEDRGVVFWSNADSRSMDSLYLSVFAHLTDISQVARMPLASWLATWS